MPYFEKKDNFSYKDIVSSTQDNKNEKKYDKPYKYNKNYKPNKGKFNQKVKHLPTDDELKKEQKKNHNKQFNIDPDKIYFIKKRIINNGWSFQNFNKQEKF